MRDIMTEARMNEQSEYEARTRNAVADRLIEKWRRKKGLNLDGGRFEKIFEASPKKARNLAIVLENQERYLKTLTETQISDAFKGTPQTVVKVIRLGYPNSVRGDIFSEVAMTTMKDTIYKVESIYSESLRDATAGGVMYESYANRFASEKEVYSTSISSTTAGATPSTTVPVRPYTVRVLLNGVPVGNDNGDGILKGATLTGTNTIDYTTGAFVVTFAESKTGTVTIEYSHNSEVTTNYSKQGKVHIQLVPHDLRAMPFPIGFSWSKMTELLMNDALGLDGQEVFITAGADELKKSLDFQAIGLANQASNWANAVTFNADWAAAGADSDYAHSQSVVKALRNAPQKTYEQLYRGGEATSYVCGPKAATYLTGHKGFVADTTMPTVGAYLFGYLNGIPLYQVPSDIVATNEILCIYKNNREDANDSCILNATYIPLYRTPTLEFSSFHSEAAISFFGDLKIATPEYATKVKLENLTN